MQGTLERMWWSLIFRHKRASDLEDVKDAHAVVTHQAHRLTRLVVIFAGRSTGKFAAVNDKMKNYN